MLDGRACAYDKKLARSFANNTLIYNNMKTKETRNCNVLQYTSPAVHNLDFLNEMPILCASANLEAFGDVSSLSPDQWDDNF
jgi:hypothetical protein